MHRDNWYSLCFEIHHIFEYSKCNILYTSLHSSNMIYSGIYLDDPEIT